MLDELKKEILVPVIRLKDREKARMVTEILIKTGYRVLEMTFTVPEADKLIKEFSGKAVMGAGTVLDMEQARKASEAGAAFIVSPALEPSVISFCKKKRIPVAAGAMTPTEVHEAVKLGSDIIKIFPASLLGGPAYIKTLKSVFGQITLMPTGGITDKNCPEYLAAGADLLGIGNWLVDDGRTAEEVRERALLLKKALKSRQA